MSKKKKQQQKKKMRDFKKKKSMEARRQAAREDQDQQDTPLPRGGMRPDFAANKTGTRSMSAAGGTGSGGNQMHRPQGG
ncbi:MAG: hypothetical protein VX641_02805 [Planctomycetota bacterium]|nr:hypothetical protein [Planctomycetota bacterium]